MVHFPDDYNLECYRIYLVAEGLSAERSLYYVDVLVDDDMRIRKVERYKDNYMVNSLIRSFPPALEPVFERTMQKATK